MSGGRDLKQDLAVEYALMHVAGGTGLSTYSHWQQYDRRGGTWLT